MTTRKCRSILYVDDDPDICGAVQTALCLLSGMDVTTAASGVIGIDLAYELRPDLIILNAMMPGLDGPATYQRIRESPLIANIPVIFMTTTVLPAEVARLLALGAIGVVEKPFDPLRIGDELAAIWTRANGMGMIAAHRSEGVAVLPKVDTLVAQFLERTRADVSRIRALANCGRPDCHAELREIVRIAHSIHGAGAMFGFSAVSASGGAIERFVESQLMNIQSQPEHLASAMLLSLDELVQELASALDAAHSTLPSTSAMFH